MIPSSTRPDQPGEGRRSPARPDGGGGGISAKPTPAECQAVAGFLQGVANPVRVQILCSLRDGEKNVGEIARRVGGNQSNISRQLQILMTKGYVSRRREERNIFYQVPTPAVYELMADIFRLVCRPADQG